MKVLLLGLASERLLPVLEETADEGVRRDAPLTADDPLLTAVDVVVSYGYRHLIRPDVLRVMPPPPFTMNLHISLLPLNRGADPNLWSVLEDTPSGVTIHVLVAALDAGDILLQERVDRRADDTLRTLYARLSLRIEELFADNWHRLREGSVPPRPQEGTATIHRSGDKGPYEPLLTEGWDTPVQPLVGAGGPPQEPHHR